MNIIGKTIAGMAGIFTLVYLIVGARISIITNSGTIFIIWITGLFCITLWILVIIDIDTLLKKRIKDK